MSSLLAVTAVATPAFADKASNSFNGAFGNDVAMLDNYMATGREELVLARLLYDGLVSKNHETGEFVPELASSYEMVSDTEIDFVIRDGVKFHNGDTLTADDVVYTLNTVSKPEYGARYQIAVNWIEKAEKLEDNTVRLTMKEPYPMALEMLAGNVPIYPAKYYQEVGPEGMSVKPVGTGPYQLVSQTPGAEFTFEKFDDYYSGGQKANAQIETLNFRILPEQNTQYAELLSGGLDWIWRVPEDDVGRLDSQPGVKVESAPVMRFAYLAMNPQRPDTPLADPRVRQAINHAVNKTAIRDALVGANYALIDTACNPLQYGCTTDVTAYEYDPEKARALLEEAGYGDGFDISLVMSDASAQTQAQAIAADLGKVGINLEVNMLTYAAASDQWRNNQRDMEFTNWGSYGIGDVGMSVAGFFSGTGDDVAQDPDVIKLVTEATSIVDQERRAELYAEALKLIAERAYWVPLWTFAMNTAMAEDLSLSVSPDEFVPFWDATWN
ncbi:ABC transporter substrate-binding protein [Paracoccus alkanivorans]|uniref:ABC transporter substrate-binding protein n=1 Tax=Paracoccus alkanivorans TaxID=2116655 RepID=A0A3M0MF25_9RHOB|nr:ABC transporter substrate-binding protein [Paracoccus alkanivorans]